jgi:hypothetical protein
MVAGEQNLHGEPVAGCDLGDQRRVRGVVILRFRRPPGGDIRDKSGKVAAHW